MNNSSLNLADIENQLDDLEVHPLLSKTARIALAVFLITALVVGTIGNVVVLALFIKYKSLRTTSNIFVINLTAADLMMCLVCLPMLINSFLRGQSGSPVQKFFCNFDTFFGAFTGFLSIWSLVCLAIDRCIVITRQLPVRHSSDKLVAYYIVAGIWILALVGAGLPFVGFGRFVIKGVSISCGTTDHFSESFSNIVYNIIIQIVYFLIPITCITSCYAVIFVKVRGHEKKYFDAGKQRAMDETAFRRSCRSRTLERNELKTAKAGCILIAVFCFSWAPYSIVSWIGLFGNRSTLTLSAVTLPAIFAKVSTILNPLLYALLLQSFKAKFRILWKQYFRSPYSCGSLERETFYPTVIPRSSYHITQRGTSSITPV